MSHFYENRQSTYQDDEMADRVSYPEEDDMNGHSMAQGSQYAHSGMPMSPRSWVQYQEPPMPVEESMSHAPSVPTPFHGPRPLPDPFAAPRRHIYPADPIDDDLEDEAEEDEFIENTVPIMHSVYQGQGYGLPPQSHYHEAPQPTPSPTHIPVVPLRPQRTFVGGFFKGLKKVFRGGKESKRQLRRKNTFGTEGTSTSMTHGTTGDTLPRYLSNPSIGPSNPQFARRLTMAVNNGNLPPDINPNAFDSRSPPFPSPHHDSSQPLGFQFRPENNNDLQLRSTPQYPSVLITPPTDSYAEGERAEVENADHYDEPPPHEEENEEQQYSDDEDDQPRPLDVTQERTTMMMYNNTDPSHPSQHGHGTSQGHPGSSSHPTSNSHPYSNAPSQSHHHSIAPSHAHPYSNAPSQSQPYSNAPSQSQPPYSNAPSQSQPPYSNAPSQSAPYSHSPSQYPQYSGPSVGPSRMPSNRRVSYPSELPTRATMEAMNGRQMPPPVPPLPETSMSMVPTSPRRRTFFSSRRPTTAGGTSMMSPKSGTSMTQTQTMTSTSGYTVSTLATSCYDPSFDSDLNPVEKFFKGLYNLPWIAQERVTVDYRPAESPRAKAKVRSSAKKAMPSWYRSLVTRSRVGTIDAVSNGDQTVSVGDAMSPSSRRTRREHRSHRHHSPTKPSRRHRRHRRRTVTTMTGTTDTGFTSPTVDAPQRAASPLVPGNYPYAYPPYPYTYPYAPYPTMSPPPRESASRSASPRASRKHKSSRDNLKYAGYPQHAYQPMAIPGPSTPPGMPPGPFYFVSPSPPGSNHGADGRQGMPMQVSPVLMHYIPAFNANPMRSPVQHPS